ncbi:ankyrin repeat-containing domain protein [Xylariales sp. PMI_506]|nr:ankyrin repeat-containing domain protein [Xylariales sp. PMI_506]
MTFSAHSSSQSIERSLWSRAHDALANDVQSILDQAKTHRRDILSALLEEVEKKRAISIRKKWKSKALNGEVIVVRDVLEQIVGWISLYKKIGGTAVPLSVDMAMLPWAAVRFLLKIAPDEVQRLGSLVQNLEIVCRIVSYYKKFELSYPSQGKRASLAHHEDALISLYTDVLNYLAQEIELFSEAKPDFVRVDDQGYIQKILMQEDEIPKLAKLRQDRDLRAFWTNPLRLRDELKQNTRPLSEESRAKMVVWLSDSPIHLHHEIVSQLRTPNSGQWLLDHPTYRNWSRKSSPSALWIHGSVGLGKTHICSVMVDSLIRTISNQPRSTPFAYFYCLGSASESERSCVDDILGSVLHQIAIMEPQNHVRNFLYTEFERRSKSADGKGQELSKLKRKECVDLIIEAANEDPITIVLDAVDQIHKDHQDILFHELARIMREASNVVKVFVTSRDYDKSALIIPLVVDISIENEYTPVDMVESVFRDIDDIGLLDGNISHTTRTSLAHSLVSQAGGRFLWAQRQIELLRLGGITREDDLLPMLETNMSFGLDQLYGESLRQILNAENPSRQILIRMFSWFLYMKAPLTPSALVAAINTADSGLNIVLPTDLSNMCSNLVVFDMTRDICYWAHPSIREHILKFQQSLFSSEKCHRLLASACIEIISRGPPSGATMVPHAQELYLYAATHWATHFRNAEVVESNDDLFHQLISFIFVPGELDVSNAFEAWINSCTQIASLMASPQPLKSMLSALANDVSSPIFLGAAFGIDILLDFFALPDQWTDWNRRNSQGSTALYVAADLGHASSVAILIDQGVGINVECGHYGSPLYAACYRGYWEVVKTLLENGASTKCGAKFKNALEAAFKGHQENIVIALVREGSSISSEREFEQAVKLAAEYGYDTAFQELLKLSFAPSEQNAKRQMQTAVVIKAIQAGQLEFLQKLLGNLTEFSISTHFPHDAVAIAALHGHDHLIQFLLDKGMDIEVEGQFGTPLRSASLANKVSIVQLLLQCGADIDAGKRNGNALYVAAVKGHVGIVKLLMQEGADVNEKTGALGTILQAAAYHKHQNIVEILMDAGADMYAEGFVPDAFHAAALSGHVGIVKFLLEKGYRYSAPLGLNDGCTFCDGPSRYRSLLREASPGRRDRTELENRDPSPMRTSRSQLKRQGAMSTPTNKTITWIDDDLDVSQNAPHIFNARGRQPLELSSYYPLEAAAAAGSNEVISILLSHKRAFDISKSSIDNAIQAATFNGHLGTVKFLLDLVAKHEPVVQYISLIFSALNHNRELILQYALSKAAESGCSENEINEMTLKMPPLSEKYQILSMEGRTILRDFIECCKYGDYEGLSSILACKQRVLLRQRKVARGCRLAAMSGHKSLLGLLLDHPSTELSENAWRRIFITAAENGHVEVLKLIVSRRKSLPRIPNLLSRATFVACRNGHPKILEYLTVALNVDINTDILEEKEKDLPEIFGGFSFREFIAGMGGSDDSSSENERNDLLTGKAEPTSKVNTLVSPLQIALRSFKVVWPFLGLFPAMSEEERSRREATVVLLLEHGADPNSQGGQDCFPLEVAVRFCPELVVEKLLEAGADATRVDEMGASALTTAVVERELETVAVMKRLLVAGATLPTDPDEADTVIEKLLTRFTIDPKIQTSKGGRFDFSPSLEYVFEEGPGKLLETLLRHYGHVRANDARYSLVLQECCLLGKTGFVRLLLSRGVNVNGTGYYYGNAIQAAARGGWTEIVNLLLAAGAEINTPEGRWSTPVRAAIVSGHSDVFRLLMDHGADVALACSTERLNSRDHNQQPLRALELAVESGNIDIVKAALEADSVWIENDSKRPHPLIRSCQQGRLDIASLLLDYGTQINMVDNKYHSVISGEYASPLHAAVIGGHAALVETLLRRGADPNIEYGEIIRVAPLFKAIEKADLHIIQLLLDAGADIHRRNNGATALSTAIIHGNMAVIKKLIAGGAEATIHPSRWNPFYLATDMENPDVMELLLETMYSSGNEDTESIVDDAFEIIANKEQPKDSALRLLLDYSAQPTLTRFIWVCAAGSVPIATRMLEQGMDVNGDDENTEFCPLQVAARYLREEMVYLLLHHGAQVNYKGTQLKTPLMLALEACATLLRTSLKSENAPRFPARHRHVHPRDFSPITLNYQRVQQCTHIVQSLLERGADVVGDAAATDGDFGGPLHLACWIGNTSLVKALLDKGADVRGVGGYFQTTLFAAIEGGNHDVMSLLLERGVDVNLVHPDYGTPMHFASTLNDPILTRLLVRYRAMPTLPTGQCKETRTV